MSTNKIFIPYYISSNTGAPAQVLPRVFFYNGLKESDPYWIQHWTTSSFGKTIIAEQYSSFPYFDNYSGQVTTTSSLSLLFLNEDPVYSNQVPSQSLYDLYWAKYVDLLYNPRTRIIRISAVLPFPVYQKLELNDIIQLRSNYYHLRAINDYNLRTGECRMELLGPLLAGALNQGPFFPTYYSTFISASVQKNNCPTCQTGSFYNVILPASYSVSTESQAVAQAEAQIYFNSISQSEANASGSCLTSSYYSYAISSSVEISSCSTCLIGTFNEVTLSASYSYDTCSQTNAQLTAQAYFNANSQSWSNAIGGTCTSASFNTTGTIPICRTGSLTFQSDIQDLTAFPLSVYLFTSNSSIAFSNNQPLASDPHFTLWKISAADYYTGSTILGLFPSVSGSGPSGADRFIAKVRGVNGVNINYVGNTATGSQFVTTAFAVTNFYATGTIWPVANIEVKPKLFNNYTQSIGTGYDLPLNIEATGSFKISASISNITGSYIYTSSANYPSLNDPKWKEFAFYDGTANTGKEYVYITGSLTKTNVDVYVSASNYYYFKYNNNLGNTILFNTSSILLGDFAQVTASISASTILQTTYNFTTQSNNNLVTITLQ